MLYQYLKPFVAYLMLWKRIFFCSRYVSGWLCDHGISLRFCRWKKVVPFVSHWSSEKNGKINVFPYSIWDVFWKLYGIKVWLRWEDDLWAHSMRYNCSTFFSSHLTDEGTRDTRVSLKAGAGRSAASGWWWICCSQQHFHPLVLDHLCRVS